MMNRLAYFHIAKTAGTTLNNYISERYPISSSMWEHREELGYIDYQLLDKQEVFRSHDFICGHLTFEMFRKIENVKKFTVLRNPVQRTISNYTHLYRMYQKTYNVSELNDVETYNYKRFHDEKYSLSDFLNDETMQRRYIANYQVNMLTSMDSIYAETVEECFDLKRLDLAKKNLCDMDFFGITEALERTFLVLNHEMNWYPYKVLRCDNKSDRNGLEYDLSPRVSRKLDMLLEHDVELYEFACDLFAESYRDITYQTVAESYWASKRSAK